MKQFCITPDDGLDRLILTFSRGLYLDTGTQTSRKAFHNQKGKRNPTPNPNPKHLIGVRL